MMLFCFLMNGLSCFRQDSAPGRAELLSSASSLSFTISRSWQWQASDTKGAGKTRWHVCMSSIDSISPQPYKSSKYCLVIKRTGHIQNKNNNSPTNCLLPSTSEKTHQQNLHLQISSPPSTSSLRCTANPPSAWVPSVSYPWVPAALASLGLSPAVNPAYLVRFNMV